MLYSTYILIDINEKICIINQGITTENKVLS